MLGLLLVARRPRLSSMPTTFSKQPRDLASLCYGTLAHDCPSPPPERKRPLLEERPKPPFACALWCGDWQGTRGSTLMKDPDALVHGAGRGQRRGRFVGLQLVGHILVIVDDKCRTLLPHPVCINRPSSIAPPRRRTSSRTPRGRSTSPRPPLPRDPVHRPRPSLPLHISPPG